MRILALSGSLRAGSSNTALLLAGARLAAPEVQIVLFSRLGELPHFNPDLDGEGDAPPPAVAALRAEVSAADGVIICSPEYARGVPGSLKNALDWLVSHADFACMPVLLWNASAAGGQHAQASLVETLRTMSAKVLVEASLLTPFLHKKLGPGAELSAEAAQALKGSLAALARAVEEAQASEPRRQRTSSSARDDTP
jgi:NAD(P)H-dependent FMN reductase